MQFTDKDIITMEDGSKIIIIPNPVTFDTTGINIFRNCLIFMHRNNVAAQLGLVKRGNVFRWTRMYNKYALVESHLKRHGFDSISGITIHNELNTSEAEKSIPEFINIDIVYFMTMLIDNGLSEILANKIENKIIPYCTQYCIDMVQGKVN